MPEYLNLASTTTVPSPDKTLTIYRHSKNRLFTFEPSPASPASYVLATTKSSSKSSSKSRWSPLLYRGPTAVSAPESPIIGSLRRSAFWTKLTLELGDGVAQVEHNRDAERLRVSEARKRRWRWWFGMREKQGKEMEDVDVTGLVLGVYMERRPRVGRRVGWEFDGVEYVWTGTRVMARSWFKGVRGYSHDMKLVRTPDHALIATYEKKHLGRNAGPGMDGKGKKRPIGTLRIYPAAYERSQTVTVMGQDGEMAREVRLAPRHRMGSNMTETHTGDIFEEAVVMTCWAALEAEHRIRHTILDILIAIAEDAGG
ncbi:hypothetical protein V496_05630 [Pseudogymnoascus sp. VKM F-4515 (FW-2607)]|nr:hypothetical protein V496_05630 [Pseudogymnoascus sp. VKM F-4515 (FW-2607)]KFY86515.1 hypothetical protein V498_07485 [Pseudogymnoascus sp. VKM F-4517 (FW-2822)]